MVLLVRWYMVQFVDVRTFQKKCLQAKCAWDAPQQGMHAPEKKKQEKKMVPQVAFFFSLCWRKCQQTNGHETSRRWIVFFAKRICVSPAVVADQTAVLTDESNVEEVATSEALSESDGSGTESQSGESESDVC